MMRAEEEVVAGRGDGHSKTIVEADGKVITLLNTQNKIDGRIKWAMNNMSFTLPDTPYLVAPKLRLHHVFN
ncbi:hypothetical protein QJS10_CPB12g01243 [Acorus calamus]|uniref:Uncharacterized protein n=1 Tax=Acorus calamus TaxID=4465 RepID=A0AAV9DQ66_ACOCL|nr:hypothetical protein QJS10_CPB12g01243 [Acorus calamus]